MTKPGNSLWNRTHKTWVPSSNPRRCTSVSDGPCKAAPIKGVTLCVHHAIMEHKRVAEGYFKAKNTYEAFVDMLECLHDALQAVTGETATSMLEVALDLDKIVGTKELRADVEERLPLPPRRGRPAIDRDPVPRAASFVRRRGNNVASNRPDQWIGHVSTPEEQEEEMRALGYVRPEKIEDLFVKREELTGEDSQDKTSGG